MSSIDTLLVTWGSPLKNIISLLNTDPSQLVNLWKILSNDSHCKGSHSQNTRYRSLCSLCTDLSHIGNGELGKPFMIQYGRLTGVHLLVEKIAESFHPRIQYLDSSLKSGGVNELVTDPISNKVISTIVVDLVCNEANTLITAFRCGSSAYELKLSDMPLDTIQPSIDVLRRVIDIFSRLSPFNFTHGNPSPHSIRVLSGNQLRLNPGDYSSFTSGNTRIHTYVNVTLASALDHINSYVVSDNYYTIRSISHESFSFIERRRSGVNLYPSSFDLYCIIVGLACDEGYRKLLEPAWNGMWPRFTDILTIDTRIQEWKSRNSTRFPQFNDIFKMIQDLVLRQDLLTYLQM